MIVAGGRTRSGGSAGTRSTRTLARASTGPSRARPARAIPAEWPLPHECFGRVGTREYPALLRAALRVRGGTLRCWAGAEWVGSLVCRHALPGRDLQNKRRSGTKAAPGSAGGRRSALVSRAHGVLQKRSEWKYAQSAEAERRFRCVARRTLPVVRRMSSSVQCRIVGRLFERCNKRCMLLHVCTLPCLHVAPLLSCEQRSDHRLSKLARALPE